MSLLSHQDIEREASRRERLERRLAVLKGELSEMEEELHQEYLTEQPSEEHNSPLHYPPSDARGIANY